MTNFKIGTLNLNGARDGHKRMMLFEFVRQKQIDIVLLQEIVSGYVCNHGSPSGERDTASPRGRYGERPQRDWV